MPPSGQLPLVCCGAAHVACGSLAAVSRSSRRRIYRTREEAKADVFDYIECFYNRRRSHAYLDYLSPVEYENQRAGT